MARGCEIKEITYDPQHCKDVAIGFIDGEYDNIETENGRISAGSFNEENVIEVPQNVKTLNVPTVKLRDMIIQKQIVWFMLFSQCCY